MYAQLGKDRPRTGVCSSVPLLFFFSKLSLRCFTTYVHIQLLNPSLSFWFSSAEGAAASYRCCSSQHSNQMKKICNEII